jgi:hypothetical protein
VEVLSARPPPDGDYLYTVQVEDDPSEDHQGRLLVLYRLVSLESGSEPSTYLLPKVVAQDGSGQDSTMERRPVLDLGDRELSLARLPGVADPVVLGAGEWAHVEVTLRRLYVYRQSYDQDAQPDPVDTVLSIRSFPESLIGDGERPQPGKELEQALAPLCQSLGVGDRSQDARGSGVDTRELLGW